MLWRSLTGGVSAILITIFSGCAARHTYTPPDARSARQGVDEVVIKSPFDQAWLDLISHLADSFFAIDTYEKESGLLTLSWSASAESAHEYIDCGHIDEHYPLDTGDHGWEGPFAVWYARSKGVDLSSRMNIFVRPVDESTTSVKVRALYSFGPWEFSTGEAASVMVSVRGRQEARTCQPTFAAEGFVLAGVRK